MKYKLLVLKFAFYIICLFLIFPSQLIADNLTTDNQSERLSIPQVLEKLKKGGLVIYMRHAHTDHTLTDQRPIDMTNCHKQRTLNDKGRAQARTVGEKFRQLKINISEAFSSPFCRCLNTARLLLDSPPIIETRLSYSIGLSPAKRKINSIFLLSLINRTLVTGNRLIVSHTANLRDLTGVWLKNEGDMVVYESSSPPRLVGYIPIEHWMNN